MENISADIKNYDISNAYVGIYFCEEGYRIGLFKKTTTETVAGDYSYKNLTAQYYKDLLSDNVVALWLDKNGADRKCVYSTLSGDPEEMINWKGVRGAVNSSDVSFYNISKVTAEVDRHINLVEVNSALPDLANCVSLVELLDSIVKFYSKFSFHYYARKQIEDGLKLIPQYFADKEILNPMFSKTSMKLNEVNISENFNTNKNFH